MRFVDINILNFRNSLIWLLIVSSFAVITGNAIADQKWFYFGLILIPFLIWLCIEKPFIFPFGAYAFFLPFDSILSITGSARGATLTKFLGLLTIVVLLFKGVFENKLKKPDSASIWWILFVLYGVISVFWAVRPDRTISIIPTSIGLLILYLISTSYQIQKNEYSALKWSIMLGGFLAGLLTIYSYSKGQYFHGDTFRAAIKFGEKETFPNKLAFEMLFPFSISIAMMLKQNQKIKKALFLIVIVVMVFSIVLTGSRGGLLGACTILIVYILLTREVTFGVISLILGISVLPLIPEFFLGRISQSMETHASGRFEIWIVGLKALEKYWLIGIGMNNFHEAYNEFAPYAPKFLGWSRSPHNIYLGFFVEMGIVGVFLIIIGIWKHYQAIWARFNFFDNRGRNQIMLMAALCGILISSIPLDTFWYKSFWLLWMMIIMHKNISFHGFNSTI